MCGNNERVMRDPAVGTEGDGGKHPEKLPARNRPIQLVSSYSDEQRRPINLLVLSLGNNLPGKAKQSCDSCDVCESV